MDIFDKIMRLPLLRRFQPIYKKYKEPLLYLFFGALTTVVSIFTFALFAFVFNVNELVSNVFSWIFSVTFAYVTNKIWVFDAKSQNSTELLKQIFSFFCSRLLTLGVEEVIILVFVIWLGFDSMKIKIIAQIVIVILNYIISKLLVFKKS